MYPFKNGENDDALIVSTTINFQKKKKGIYWLDSISLKTSHNKAHSFTFHLTK